MPPSSPMSFGQWFAESFALPLRNLSALWPPILYYGLPALLIGLAAAPAAGALGQVGLLLVQLAYLFFAAAFLVRVVRLTLFGKPATPQLFVREDAAAYLVLIVYSAALLALNLLLYPIAATDPAELEAGTATVPGGMLLLGFVAMGAAIYGFIRLVLALPAAASGAPTPFRTSWYLTRGRFGPTAGRVLTLGIVQALAQVVLLMPVAMDPGVGLLALPLRVLGAYFAVVFWVGMTLLFRQYAPPDGMAQLEERVAAEGQGPQA